MENYQSTLSGSYLHHPGSQKILVSYRLWDFLPMANIIEGSCCHCSSYSGPRYWIDDSEYCGDCCKPCNCCGTYINIHDRSNQKIDHGLYICEDCLETHYFTCNDCEGIYPRDEMNDLGSDYTGYVCDDCHLEYSECDRCGSTVLRDTLEIIDGDQICSDCVRNNFTQCNQCDNYYLDELNICPICHPNPMTDYHEIDVAVKYGFGEPGTLIASQSPYFLGLELEYNADENDFEEDTTEEIGKILDGFAIMARDSSVTWGEIITRPDDLPTILDKFEELWKNIPFRENGLVISRKGSKTGLHINIDKSAFTDINAIAFFVMMITNNPRYSKFIAGRDELYNCDYTTKTQTDVIAEINGHSAKYQPVCIKKDRLEVRIYLSTSRIDFLQMRCEHTLALADYSNICSKNNRLPDIADFLKFVDQYQEQYPELHKRNQQYQEDK